MSKTNNVQVKWEDQKNINSFNKLNNRAHELEVERYAEHLEEAGDELMLVDDDEVHYAMSDCLFVHLPREDLEEIIQEKQEKAKLDVEMTKQEAGKVEKQMEGLKTTLYSKFGNAINLEED